MIDPSEPDARAKDTDAKRLLFMEANELLKDQGVFMLACRALRIRWYREWLDEEDREKQRDLRARLKFIDAAPEEIRRFVSDYSMAVDRQKNARRA
jgi:hypothetical protein